MKKKRTISCIVLTCMIISILSLGITFADESQSKLSDLNSQINSLQKELKEGKSEESKLNSQLKNLDNLIKEAEAEVANLQRDIESTQAKVAEAQKQLDAKQAEMDQQNEDMGERVRTMYKNGDVGTLEILLGSESLTDFMTNLDMTQKIFDNDVQVLEEMEAQYKEMEVYKNQLATLQRQLENKQADQATKKKELATSRGNIAEMRSQVAGENKDLEKQVDALNAEANAIKAEILRLQGGGSYTGGTMLWPAPASHRVTSPFGYRIHPILGTRKLHTGVDIGVGTGSQVLAANAGTVIKAAWNNSYGYMVMVDHGGGIVTLYAHNSQLKVKAGDTVARGDLLALSGSTGMSTGPHLHFEVRVNGDYQNPLNYIQ